MARLGTYSPREPARQYLEYCWELINSVPYKVSLRWLFYRLLDSGDFKERVETKKSYRASAFVDPLAQARRRFYGPWRPWTLADESRDPVYAGGWRGTVKEWAESLLDRNEFQFSPYEGQSNPVILVYEARAMTQQFRYHAGNFDLYPIAGDSSIPFNWRIVNDAAELGGAAVVYFGDLDKKGGEIYQGFKDIFSAFALRLGFEPVVIRGGLTEEQAERFRLTPDPLKKTTYQWESLGDDQAAEIIRNATAELWDQAEHERGRELSAKADKLLRGEIERLIERLP